MSDLTKAAEELLTAVCGYRANGKIDNLRALPIIEAWLRAAERQGAVDALRAMEEELAAECEALGSNDWGLGAGLNSAVISIGNKADRIEAGEEKK